MTSLMEHFEKQMPGCDSLVTHSLCSFFSSASPKSALFTCWAARQPALTQYFDQQELARTLYLLGVFQPIPKIAILCMYIYLFIYLFTYLFIIIITIIIIQYIYILIYNLMGSYGELTRMAMASSAFTFSGDSGSSGSRRSFISNG